MDVEPVVVLGGEGGLGVGAGLHGEDVALLDAGARAGDVGGEAAGAGEVGDVVGVGVPEVAVGAGIVVRVGDVDAALVAGACGRPCGDVVASLDFEGCELFVVVAGGGDRDDLGLGPLFALVEPDGATEDGQVLGFVNVDGLIGLGAGVCGRNEECDITEVNSPATGDPVNLYVVVGVVIVGAWSNLDKVGGKFGVSLFVHPEAKFGAVEVFTIGNCVDGCSSGDSVFCLWSR